MPTLTERSKISDRQEWSRRKRHRTDKVPPWFLHERHESREQLRAWQIETTKAGVSAECVSHKENPCEDYYTSDVSNLAQEFSRHVSIWRRQTKHYSSVTKMVVHPSYLRIIGMGRRVLPLLFEELSKRSDHWLIALNAITGEDPAPPESTFSQAVAAWLSWGRDNGYIA
jgi:hypothetical protein